MASKRIVASECVTEAELMQYDRIVSTDSFPADATLLYRNRRNRLVRLTVAGRDVVVKCFKRPHLLNALIYARFRKSKAERSFENASYLIANGFHTPMPLAFGEMKSSGRLTTSHYFCAYVEGDTMREITARPECDTVLRAVAADLVKLHRLGIYMRDYTPGNLLYSFDRQSGAVVINYVDLNRIDFGVTDRRTLLGNLGTLVEGNDAIAKFATYYAEAAGLNPAELIEEAMAAKAEFEERRRRKKRFKSLFKL